MTSLLINEFSLRSRGEIPVTGLERKLWRGFRQLRGLGYFTKRDWLCCTPCCWSRVPQDRRKVVFYHGQDTDQLRATGQCYLAWSGDPDEIRRVLEDNGIATEWNGHRSTRILVRQPRLH